MKLATYQRTGALLTHQWEFDEYVEQDGDDVVVDGYRIENAELLRVEHRELDSDFDRIKQKLGRLLNR